MLRIVGLQRSESAQREFVLLQNQGTLRLKLRGHVVMSESAIDDPRYERHVFDDDEVIPAGMYVLLTSGVGETRWAKTKDGALVYYVFMNRDHPIWGHHCGPIHILSIQHTYVERTVENLLKI